MFRLGLISIVINHDRIQLLCLFVLQDLDETLKWAKRQFQNKHKVQ